MIEKSSKMMFVIAIVLELTLYASYITYDSASAIEPGVCIHRPDESWACNCPSGTHQEDISNISSSSSDNT
jgi:hypothetical protein